MAVTAVVSASVFNSSLPWIGLESLVSRAVSSLGVTLSKYVTAVLLTVTACLFSFQLSDLYKKDHGLDPDPPRVGEKRLK